MVTIIADASYCHETGGAGYGYWTASARGKRGGGGSIKQQVDGSSAAEMIALVNALHLSVQHQLVLEGDHILLQTDCMSAIGAFNGTRTHLTRDERAAKTALFGIKRTGKLTLSFRHVKGHSKRPEARYVTNNLCDERAKAGMRLARQRFGKTGKDVK